MTRGKWINPDGSRMTCTFEGCGRDVYALGLCSGHRKQARQGVPLRAIVDKRGMYKIPGGGIALCKSPGCESDASTRGLCGKHYTRSSLPNILELPPPPVPGAPGGCGAPDCNNRGTSRGLCELHYAQWRRGVVFSNREGADICPSPGCGREKIKSALLCKRCRQLAWRYSLSTERLLWFFKSENYKCSNVGCLEKTNLHMDHSHGCCPDGKFDKSHKKSCGECVRGWLCKGCNNALGFLQENPRRIQGLLVYLMAGGSLNR